MKTIVHIDLNAFFAQCELLSDPTLKGKPIAIAYDSKRSVLSTASYEARAFGVNSAMPVSTAKRLCKNLVIIPPHFELYSYHSKHFFSYLKKRYPILEQASIDECYIDMTDDIPMGKEQEYLFDLQMTLYRVTKLKCSIGCGANRFLAKMGSDMKKPLGLTILNQGNIPTLLWPLAISKMYGIGKKTAPKLVEAGVLTIGDLAHCEDPKVKKILGNNFEYYKGHAQGFGSDFIDNSAFDPKSMSSERTFQEDAFFEEGVEMIKKCCEEVCQELHKYHKKALSVGVKLRTPDFVTKSRRTSFSEPIDDVASLFAYAMKVFEQLYKDQPIRLIGVSIERVIDSEENKEDDHLIEEWNSKLEYGGKILKASDIVKK